MWVMKVSLDAKKLFLGSLAIKHKVAVFGSPLSFSHDKNGLTLQVSGVLVGENKDKFLRDFRKSIRVSAVEDEGDFVVASYRTPALTRWLDNKHLVHSAHLSIDLEGKETLTIESFQKASLLFLLEILKSRYNARLLCIGQRESSSIPVLRSSIRLTGRQRYALELALKNGYYKQPRQVSVKGLSKIANLSFSTFQQHLRKAESKVLPSI